MPTSRLAVAAIVVLAAGCSEAAAPSAEERFIEEYRGALDEMLGEDAPEYTDEELLTFGNRACENLEEVEDGDALRRNIEAAGTGVSDSETLQIAQATVLVTSAAEHLCPEQGERLGLTVEGSSA